MCIAISLISASETHMRILSFFPAYPINHSSSTFVKHMIFFKYWQGRVTFTRLTPKYSLLFTIYFFLSQQRQKQTDKTKEEAYFTQFRRGLGSEWVFLFLFLFFLFLCQLGFSHIFYSEMGNASLYFRERCFGKLS